MTRKGGGRISPPECDSAEENIWKIQEDNYEAQRFNVMFVPSAIRFLVNGSVLLQNPSSVRLRSISDRTFS